jgi:hypothetical protein
MDILIKEFKFKDFIENIFKNRIDINKQYNMDFL